MSEKTLLEDDSSTAKPAGWDMGTGENEGQPQPAPAPGDSTWRHTASPTPTTTHGIQDAAAVLPERAKAAAGGNKYGGNMPDEFDENFPDDLKKCWAIVRTIDNYYFSNARSAAATREYFRRRSMVGKHIMKLSNGPPAPEMTSDRIAEMQRARDERPAMMNSRIAELTAYLVTPFPDESATLDMDKEASDPEARQKLGMSPKLRLILHPAVVQWVQIARRFACSAEKFSLDNFDLIHPTEHVILLERQLVTSIEPARIRELQEKISKSKEFGSNRAGELAMKGHAESKKEPVFKALDAAIKISQWLVSRWQLEAILVEESWFGEFAISWHPTFLSKQFSDLGTELEKLNARSSCFAWFGVNDVAELDD